jgi:hypothetical protein
LLEQCLPNKKPRFPQPNGFTPQPRTSAHLPQARRQVPNFRSEFTLSHGSSRNLPSGPSMQKQIIRTRPLQVVNLESLVFDDRTSAKDPLRSRDAFIPDENAPSIASPRVISPPVPPLPAMALSKPSKVMEPPRFHGPPQRPSTPPKSLAAPDLTRFLSPSHDHPRPSKPISRTRIALATDLWTEGGRADLLGLALEQHGVQHATPIEKAIRRGLQVSPRKVGIDREIRYVR